MDTKFTLIAIFGAFVVGILIYLYSANKAYLESGKHARLNKQNIKKRERWDLD